MKVLSVCVSKRTLDLLKGKRIVCEEAGPEDLPQINEFLETGFYDCLVVDVESANSGQMFVRLLRKKEITVPVIGIALEQEETSWSELRADFLEYGGDDLIRKPENPRELIASIFACVRREHGTTANIQIFKHNANLMKVDLTNGFCYVNGEEVHLTTMQSSILCVLALRRGRVVSKETLMQVLYPNDADEAEIKIIDVYISKIRKEINALAPGLGNIIETVWGRGYTMKRSENNTINNDPDA